MVTRGCEDIEPLRVAIESAEEVGLEDEDLQPAVVLLRKLEAGQQPLTFTHLPRDDMERLQVCSSKEEVLAILCKCMGLAQPAEASFQQEVLAEFHYQNFLFCQRNSFGPEKASTFLSLMCALHAGAISKGSLPEQEAHKLFESMLARHSQQLPPYSLGVFSQQEVAEVRERAEKSFFRHYKMYAYTHKQRQDLSVRLREPSVVPKVPPVVGLHQVHEVNPREVPELQDLFSHAEESLAQPSDG